MARLPLEFHPGARIDALESYDWYAKRAKAIANHPGWTNEGAGEERYVRSESVCISERR